MPTQTGSLDLKGLKEAGGLAVAAQDSVDNLEIGGRNLIIGTLYPKTLSTSFQRPHIKGQAANTGIRHTCTAAEHGIRGTLTSANWQYISFGATGYNETPSLNGLVPGETYTLSADLSWKVLSSSTGKANTTTYYMGAQLDASKNESGAFEMSDRANIFPITQADKGTDMSGRLVFTFTVPSDAIRLYLCIKANINTASHYAAGDYIEARNIKLEKGTKATGWTPAPEDLDESLMNVQESMGARNYFVLCNAVDGYLHSNGKSIVTSDQYKEYTSDWIPVTPGERLTTSTWVTRSGDVPWIAHAFYSSKDLSSALANRTAKTGTAGVSPLRITDIVAPANSAYMRVSYRNFSDTAYVKIERSICGTEWSPAPEDLQAETEEAKKVATNYVTDLTGNDGILVHKENSTDGVRITDEVDIIRDGDIVARFGAGAGETAVLGKDGSGQVEVSSKGMREIGADGGEVMTARSSDVQITAPYAFALKGKDLIDVGDTETIELPTITNAFEIRTVVGRFYYRHQFTVGTSKSYQIQDHTIYGDVYATLAYDAVESTITLTVTTNTTANESAYLESCRYTAQHTAPYFTFGTREGDAGGYSTVIGSSLYGTRNYQTVIGKNNKEDENNPDQSPDYAFIVGNGTDEVIRNDAFRVGWDGDIEFFSDAQNSAVDEEITIRLGNFEQYVYEGYGNGIMSLKALLLQLIYILQYKFGSLGFSNDTVINSGATQAVTIPTNSTHLMVVTSGGTAQRGMYMVTCTSANATTSTAMHAVSTLTITTGSSGTISVKNTGSQPVRLNFLTMQGNTVGGPT